jgi:hypothetical protein
MIKMVKIGVQHSFPCLGKKRGGLTWIGANRFTENTGRGRLQGTAGTEDLS